MAEYAIDFETYYDAECSVKTLGLTAYVAHPAFKVTYVAVYNDQYRYAGPVADFDFSILDRATLVAHNAAFDKACFDYLGWSIEPKGWVCTAAISRYLNGPGSLADCARAWLGETIDKGLRDRMSGGQIDLFDQDEVEAYAMTDARICWELYRLLRSGWPESEYAMWQITLEMGRRGVCVDQSYIAESCKTLSRIVDEQTEKLPWTHVGRPALSIDSFRAWCGTVDVLPPVSTSATDDDLDDWRDANAGSPAVAWLDAMQTARRANRTRKVLEAMRTRLQPDGRMAYELLYCGASTGRWSGAGGLNLQNLNRGSVAGIDIRSAIVPARGCSFVVVDYSQIESRVLLWVAGDQETLDVLRTGVDIYEAHARSTMWYRDPRPLKDADPELRLLAKARVLGLGYGCGAAKFVVVAKIMGGLDIDMEESQRIVESYRASNPLIISLWDRLERELFRHREICRFPLPSGRRLRYYFPDAATGTAESVRGRREDFFGGKLTENYVSAIARDILADAWAKLHWAGRSPVMSVHDELVFEVPTEEADQYLAEVCDVMRAGPDWATGLPLDVEGQVVQRYAK